VFDVAIVGGGAAGLATAIFIARRRPELRVTVLDGARRLGAKILVSGGGRCNVTNREVTASDYWGGDRRIVASVLQAFPAAAAAAFFQEIGVPLHEEEDGKLFPDANRARSVLDALLAEAGRRGVAIATGQRVDRVQAGEAFFVVRGGAGTVEARRLVLATGGRSLPRTGSDGAGLSLAAALGHSIVATTPALAPLVLEGEFHRPLSGVSHPAEVTVKPAGRPATTIAGPLLWTHFGVSGPAALDASRHWHRAALEGPVRTSVSFAPGLDAAGVERRLLDAGRARGTATLRTAVARWVPAAVADAVLSAHGVEGCRLVGQVERDARRRLAQAIVDWELRVTGSRGYNYAEVTAGGVALEEIHRGSMASRRCPGLYLVGEMLDVDGRLGGFNFQWAWSSAWVAARALADKSPDHQISKSITKSSNQEINT
jgi:predicted Rossmann fold flavoprotein